MAAALEAGGCEVVRMGKTTKNPVVGAACGMVRWLGVAVRVACGAAGRARRLATGAAKALGLPSRAAEGSERTGESSRAQEAIRSIVVEELARLRGGEGGLAASELEGRLQLMAETIRALQDKIAELGARGRMREADMWHAMRSVKAAESLTDEERAILVNVFRQNIAIQKSGVVDTPVGQA